LVFDAVPVDLPVAHLAQFTRAMLRMNESRKNYR
jgi:hypothetical protein